MLKWETWALESEIMCISIHSTKFIIKMLPVITIWQIQILEDCIGASQLFMRTMADRSKWKGSFLTWSLYVKYMWVSIWSVLTLPRTFWFVNLKHLIINYCIVLIFCRGQDSAYCHSKHRWPKTRKTDGHLIFSVKVLICAYLTKKVLLGWDFRMFTASRMGMQLSIIASEMHSARELSWLLWWKFLSIKICPVKIKYWKILFLIFLRHGKKSAIVKKIDIFSERFRD